MSQKVIFVAQIRKGANPDYEWGISASLVALCRSLRGCKRFRSLRCRSCQGLDINSKRRLDLENA